MYGLSPGKGMATEKQREQRESRAGGKMVKNFTRFCEKEIVELLSKKGRMISNLNDFLYSEFAEQQPNDDDRGNTFNIE